MANVIIAQRWLTRGGTATALATKNEVLLDREMCLETDTGKIKFGNGSTAYNSLPYFSAGGGGGTGAVTVVGTSTVAGSAATNITLAGLDLSADECYWGILSGKNANASSMLINMFYNSDTTATNYYRQRLVADGSTASAGRGNDASLFDVAASAPFTASFIIRADVDGRPRSTVGVAREAAASLILMHGAHIRNNTANVTTLTLNSSTASGFAIGTKLSLYKVKP